MDSKVVGVLGAGQLGRMFVEAAARLNVKVLLLDVGDFAPAKQICYAPIPATASASTPSNNSGRQQEHIDGSFADSAKIDELASKVDVLTVEIEHVDAAQLQKVLDEGKVSAVHPTPGTIKLIQDKYAQKVHLAAKGVPLGPFAPVGPEDFQTAAALQGSSSRTIADEQAEGVLAAGKQFGYPLMLKSRTQAYDGRGNFVVKSAEQATQAIKALGDGTRGLYAEQWTRFEREVAVMVVRSASGQVRSYPPVETVHRDNICHTVFAPLRSNDDGVFERARTVAERAVATFEGAGVFGVEMFLMQDGELLLNEIAPRPHNSGHYTIEACDTSQYENHLRAILDLPLGSTELKVPSAAMINILGLGDLDKDEDALRKTFAMAVGSLNVPGATVHLYGKSGCRKGRKMGHITVVGQSDAQTRDRLRPIEKILEEATNLAKKGQPLPANAFGGPSTQALVQSSSAAGNPKVPSDFTHPQPLVGIIMGSDSDLPVMLPAATFLKRFGVPFELSIVSAHRTPDRMRTYAKSAASRGLRVIIAGAGGAAHLPGMVDAMTALPVVGVPVKGSTLDGVDSLHSIVQMPRGIPVASVAINNSTNAALLAVRILGASDTSYLKAMERYMTEMEEEVLGKVEKLKNDGWDYVVKK